ncbi:SIR2-like domain-containing protein [Desulforamulus putei DSM 12395]|uniref:SIR2-like domain-containing protein n=1 Tax=Desulforamulus putei DSM 12395 TaxID=1121429 RepID=A0A1M4WKL7_9FIRM|nr:SIR2 family protein [Desulforamulus putei]SHE81755.1 SIR2-like domain-containing protein [Desulforamulus putei DSM 12395]
MICDKKYLINRFSKALYENRGAIFVGSGISKESCGVDWYGLLQPFSENLGIQIKRDDELPLIAQYIVNLYAGNRGPLINEIIRCLNKEYALNIYHQALTLTRISTIWTTNYDTLLEKAFRNFDLVVKNNDGAISRPVLKHQIELIKMHGCISSSPQNELVITQEDYEDFLVNRPATAKRLENDLSTKSFLFIGYSYRDPNLRNIMVEARRLCQRATQEHFMVLDRIKGNKKNKEEEKRQLLWCKDLRRFGINCVLIDHYDELKEVLFEVSSKSRGNTVYCTGSHKVSDPMAREIGKRLANIKNIVLHSGQSSGIGSDVVASFTEECIERKMDITERLHTFPNPYAANPDFSDNPKLIPELKRLRAKLFNATQVVVVFDGGIGTSVEFEIARAFKCKIIPVAQKETEFMKQILGDREISDFLEQVDKDYFEKAKRFCVKTEDVISCIEKILHR